MIAFETCGELPLAPRPTPSHRSNGTGETRTRNFSGIRTRTPTPQCEFCCFQLSFRSQKRERRTISGCAVLTRRSRLTPSASRLRCGIIKPFLLRPDEVVARGLLTAVRIRRGGLLTGPFVSGETPVPFTSRSPDFATLGPSCTPSRQSGLLLTIARLLSPASSVPANLPGSPLGALDAWEASGSLKTNQRRFGSDTWRSW